LLQNPGNSTSLAVIVLILLLALIILRSASKSYSSELITPLINGKYKDTFNKRILKNLSNNESLIAAVSTVCLITTTVLIFMMAGFFNLIIHDIQSTISNVILQISLIVFILIFLGELIPEWLVAKNLLIIARLTAFPVFWIEWLLRPFSRLYLKFKKWVNEGNPDNRTPISIDEITQVLHMNNKTESADEKEMLEEIVKFGNKNVDEIMKPRIDVVSLDMKTSFSEVLHVIIDSGFSRIPVYSGSFDNIRGILYVKDIFPHSHKGDSFNWQSLIREPFFVPETKKIRMNTIREICKITLLMVDCTL